MNTTLATKPLTDTEIADIKTRHEAATGGLWTLDPDGCFGPGTVVTETGGYSSMIGAIDFGHGEEADADTRFVLNAHSDMGALLAEIARLRAAQSPSGAAIAVELLAERAYRHGNPLDPEDVYDALGLPLPE